MFCAAILGYNFPELLTYLQPILTYGSSVNPVLEKTFRHGRPSFPNQRVAIFGTSPLLKRSGGCGEGRSGTVVRILSVLP